MIFLPEEVRFLAELLLAEGLFIRGLARRRGFGLRLMSALLVLLVFSAFWPAGWDGFVKVFKYLLTFGLSILFLWQLFQITPWEALFLGTAAYTVQHIAYNLGIPVFLYVRFPADERGRAALALSLLCIYLLVYGAAGLLLGQRLRLKEIRADQNRVLTLFVIAMLMLVAVCNYVRFLGEDSITPALQLAMMGYAVIGCVFALFIQFFVVQHLALRQRLEISEQLLHSQQEQFYVSEETIECINLKCHDLKYQLAALRRSMTDPGMSEALREVEEAVMVYDAGVHTGNDTLDVILTEKSLLCEKNGISLTCMADGNALRDIRDTDLYSLFGNLLDNAIESARQIQDPERRVIGLTVQNQGNLVLIHGENYFDHPIRMQGGLPETTKEDARFHGFGLRNMKLLAEKYGGSLSLSVNGDIFRVNILLPVGP